MLRLAFFYFTLLICIILIKANRFSPRSAFPSPSYQRENCLSLQGNSLVENFNHICLILARSGVSVHPPTAYPIEIGTKKSINNTKPSLHFLDSSLKVTPSSHTPRISIFLHAAVGIFKKKRNPGGLWGYGREILLEMLGQIVDSGLGAKADAIFVTLLGNDADRELAKASLHDFASTHRLPVHVLLECSNLYVAEFPTLFIIEAFAKSPNLLPQDSLVLYLHTKGMRNNGRMAADWRRYMMYFLVEKHSFCVDLLSRPRSNDIIRYESCGVLKTDEEYGGNFWWSRTSWIASKSGNIGTNTLGNSVSQLESFQWNMQNRMLAEDFLFARNLSGRFYAQNNAVPAAEMEFLVSTSSLHYCIHHTHHNMYDCPTERASIEALEPMGVFKIRVDPSCGLQSASWTKPNSKILNIQDKQGEEHNSEILPGCYRKFDIIKSLN